MPPPNLGKRWGFTVASSAASKPKGKRKRGDSVSIPSRSSKPSCQPKQRKKARGSQASAASAAAATAAPAASCAAGLAAETEAQHLKRHCAHDSHMRCPRCKWLGMAKVFIGLKLQLTFLAFLCWRSRLERMIGLTIAEIQTVQVSI